MLRIAAFVIFAVATLAMLYVVTHLTELLDAAKHDRLLQVLGAWEISVGLVIIASHSWVSAIGPVGLGVAMLFGGPVYARLTGRR